MNWITYYLNVKKLSKKLIKKYGKPDIIIGSSPHPLAMLAAVNVGKKFKIPVISEVRDFWPEVFFLGGRLKKKKCFRENFTCRENIFTKFGCNYLKRVTIIIL